MNKTGLCHPITCSVHVQCSHQLAKHKLERHKAPQQQQQQQCVCNLIGIDVHAHCALTCSSSSSSSKTVMASMPTAHALPCGMLGGRAGIVQVGEAKQLQQQVHGCSMHVESGICCVSSASCHRWESCQKSAGEAKAATSASTQGLASNKAGACLSNHSCMPIALGSHLEELLNSKLETQSASQQQRHTDLTFNMCAGFKLHCIALLCIR